jgi:type IV pilus assembly protein PilY1
MKRAFRKIGLLTALCVLAAASWLAASQQAPARRIALSAEPLSQGASQKPTLALALSVEFPTVGAQYLDPTYTAAASYIGYFDIDSCYAYVDDANADLRRFDRSGAATGHRCGGTGFSGNFMNWATSSAIDVLRLGLTGGDRIVDTASMTVLQRAMLYWSDDGNFAKKILSASEAADAVPATLRGNWTAAIVISNCLNRVTFGTGTSGSCMHPVDNADLGGTMRSHDSAALSSDAFFYARVKVCESSSSNRLADPRATYCVRYPSGNFKPIGNLQRYSDRVRVAAFGYLMDDGSGRYGGVLRAPMKFVGPNEFDVNGQNMKSNSRMEWDETTGVFISNPEGAPEGRSGVVNYLNQFGRTGGSAGRYKVVDPIGELYYEALRYLQGLPPTPQAVGGMSSTAMDGFPAYERWDDPHAGGSPTKSHACARNNILLIGDVNTHNDKSIPGNTSRLVEAEFARPADTAGNEPDFVDWTRVVGGFEAGTSVPYIDGAGIARTTSNPNPAGEPVRGLQSWMAGIANADTGANRASFYIAGMAYWANTHDIRGKQWTAEPAKQRPGMRVTTHVIDVNEGGGDSALANRRQKQLFLAAKYGGFKDRSNAGNPFLDAQGAQDNKAWEANAADGDARTYHLSSSASAVLQGLDDIFASLVSRSNALSSSDIPTGVLTPGSGLVSYQASFDPEGWSGDVLALPITVAADGNVHLAEGKKEALWSAADQLDAASVMSSNRNIVVGRVDRAGGAANAFTWSALEDTTGAYSLRALLDRPIAGAPADGLGPQRVEFLRGDRGLEGTILRKRASRLGDIVHSGIALSAPPPTNNNAPGYAAFQSAHKARPETLFVGANDGMLHAFEAKTGHELFAYVPSWMGPKLAALTRPAYDTGGHEAYVDAVPRVAESVMSDGSWKTVLVGGTGAGGQGVFALDVTDPTAFDASRVMWEFTDRDDPQMGNVLGRPSIARFRTSASTATGAPVYRTFAIVASGVNNSMADGFARTDGTPAIFLLDISKPPGTSWQLNTNYFRLSLPTDIALARTVAPGIVEPSVAVGPAGEVRYLYAGDLHGRLWKLDFTTLASSAWTFDALSAFRTAGKAVPLYIAKDAAGEAQPITMPPYLLSGPGRSTLVSFGTGKYLEASDTDGTDPQIQSVYTLYDSVGAPLDTGTPTAAIAGRARLTRATADDTGVHLGAFAWGRPLADTDVSQRAGWYFDLSGAGERQVGAMRNYGQTLLFASLLPASGVVGAGGDQASTCNSSGKAYQVDIPTGNGKVLASGGGALGMPFVVQVGASASGGLDSAGRGESVSRGSVIVPTAGGAQKSTGLLERRSTYGVLNWRRINNYQDLLHANPD